ncbi:MAG: HupE/UreJ family protein [Bryobacteraceae bacterium]
MKWWGWLPAALVCAQTLPGHTISMSNGDLQIKGNRATFQLRMPAYEITHLQDPERQLFDSFRFSSAGQEGKLIEKACHDSPSDGMYVCAGTYEFPAPVDALDVECRLARITVPNHVHLLRASRDGKSDQAMFDVSFEKALLRFRPPTPMETAVSEIFAGALRAGTALAGLLFLFTLALASRSWKELGLLTAAFLVGEGAAYLIRWNPSPRFVEAAMGLTVAYLAVEILLLPAAGHRWAVAGVLGIFHGLYFALFIRSSEYSAIYVMTGVVVTEVILLLILWLAARRVTVVHRYLAMLLIGVGMVWFGQSTMR